MRSALSRERCAAPADTTLEVRNEHTFSVVLADDSGEEQFWSGSIDRLVIGRRGDDVVWAEVLDYKSDILTEEQLAGPRGVLPASARDVRTCGGGADGAGRSEIRLGVVFLELGRVVEIRAGEVVEAGEFRDPSATRRVPDGSALQSS